MSPIAPRSAANATVPAVGRERRRLRLVHRFHRDLHLDLAREHVLDDERALLLGPDEVREPVAFRATRTSTGISGRSPSPGYTMWSKPMSLSKPLVRLRTIDPSFDDTSTMSSSRSLRFAGDDGNQIARGRRRDRQRLGEPGLLAVGRQIASVVGRPLLVAERLEPVLQVPIERLVELVRLHLEGFFVGVLAAADHALPEREHELRMPSLPHLASMNSNSACPRL